MIPDVSHRLAPGPRPHGAPVSNLLIDWPVMECFLFVETS